MKIFYPIRFVLVSGILLVAATTQAQQTTTQTTTTSTTTTADTSWKPVRRVWGYTFGDFYYDAHTDAGARGGETNYAGVPTYRNAFQFRRIYLGYDYDITKKFSASLLLSSEPSASTSVSGTTTISNGDNLVDNKQAFFIKNAYLRVKDVWTGTDLIIGEQPTIITGLADQLWGYRFIEKSISDLHKLANTYDIGASLQGTFDPATKNFGYGVLLGDGSQAALLSAANANTGFYKQLSGDVWAKFLDKKLVFELYSDYLRTAPATATIGGQSHSIWKGIASYNTPLITVGIEAFTEKINNGVTGTVGTTKTPQDAVAEGISIYAHGSIIKNKLGYFARYDSYNPDNDFNAADVYSVNTNISSYNPYQKERFYTLGLDFTPTANVHFAPNLWLYDFADQRTPGTTGYLANDHTLIYRLTFFFTFGK